MVLAFPFDPIQRSQEVENLVMKDFSKEILATAPSLLVRGESVSSGLKARSVREKPPLTPNLMSENPREVSKLTNNRRQENNKTYIFTGLNTYII